MTAARSAPPVLVAGAGPVGLSLAVALTRHDVPVRVIDAVPPRPSSESRALGVHSRTLEVFERLGALGPMLRQGRRIHGFAFHAAGRRLGAVTFDHLDAPFPFVLVLPQADTERVLLDRLTALGVEVERPVELVGLGQDADGVRVTLRRPDGREEVATTPYLAACDGGRSKVRKLLDLPFLGETAEGSLLVDCRIDWGGMPEPVDSFGNMYLGPRNLVVLGRLPSGFWRVASTMRPDDPWLDRGPTLETMQEVVADHWPASVRLHDLRWASKFVISARKVPRLREGRVFLLGDAAHIHSPAGGQGMNTGVQDAFNLAWKLAQHLHGPPSEGVLDSYHAERYQVVSELLPRVAAYERALNVSNPLGAKLRNALLSVVTNFGLVQAAGSRTLSGLAVGYPHSPITGEHELSAVEHLAAVLRGEAHPNPLDDFAFHRGPGPGERAPDAPVGGRRLFEVLAEDPRHHLLVLPGRHADADRAAALRREATAWAAGHLAHVRPVLADPTDEDLHRRYGGRHECLYLVRPDGYVGFRGQPADVEPLRAFARGKYGW